VRIVTNAACEVVDRKDYEPYGVEIRPATNLSGNTHQYTGHERDERSGLDYMHYRYHAPNLGRFLKPDNVPGSLGIPQSWNLYAYAVGNPVNFNDPTGHMYSTGPKTRFTYSWDVGAGEDTSQSRAYFHNMVDVLSAIAKEDGSNRHDVGDSVPHTDVPFPELAEAVAKSFAKKGISYWAASAPAEVPSGPFADSLMCFPQTPLMTISKQVVASSMRTLSVFSCSAYVYRDIDGTGKPATHVGTLFSAWLTLRINAGELALPASRLSALSRAGYVGVAFAGGWAVGSAIRMNLPDSANQQIGSWLYGWLVTQDLRTGPIIGAALGE
jgi:RHS repeat-associated protein